MRTKSIYKIKKELLSRHNNFHAYLLSGSPFTKGYADLYAQLKYMNFNHNKEWFKENFCIMGHIRNLADYQQPIIGYKNIPQLYEEVHKYAITMKSSEVINLPEKTFIYHKLKQNEEFKWFTTERMNEKEILKRCKELNLDESLLIRNEKGRLLNPFYRNIDFPSTDFIAETTGTFWLRARQLSIGFIGNADKTIWYNKERFSKLRELLEREWDNYIIFYNYTAELLELYDICYDLGYNVDVYCGEIKSLHFYDKYKNQDEEERFNNRKNVIIANFASGSTGMNWQCYNKMILFSLPTFKDYQQGIARINRIGQQKTCFYHVFYQSNWLDSGMLTSLNERKEYDEKLFAKHLGEFNS